MFEIKTPEKYISEPGALKNAGKYIKEYGSSGLLVAGTAAFGTVQDVLKKNFLENNISYSFFPFAGYPTLDKAKQIAEEAKKRSASFIIAAGGGRVHDASKAAGTLAGLPVISVPTIAATCASWAAVSIIYTADGDFEQFYSNPYTPRLILADTNILMDAPERYIKAGIVDTFAKWYENSLGLTGKNDPLPLQLSVYSAGLAFDELEKKAYASLEEKKAGKITTNAVDTIDSIFCLAGLVGSFVGARAYSGFAHPFYHASRRIPASRVMLHGELVAFGILTQQVLQKKPDKEIRETIQRLARFDEDFTLSDLKLTDKDLPVIAKRILAEFSAYTNFGFGSTTQEIVNGFKTADLLIREFRENVQKK
jgi:glycerol dehydrogenase-like iron-containing ADH family enzyme